MRSKVRYHVEGNEFVIENYNNAKAFASFFPAIAGIWGKPMWVFYVNRGQSIACFGTKDKDGAIVEFNAANKAYRQTPLQGFRTFIKCDGAVYEPFKNLPDNAENGITNSMYISSYDLKLSEKNTKLGFEVSVEYFTIPNENIPALARVMTIKNIGGKDRKIECIDGLPIIIPYGTNNFLLKNISRLAEGWYNGVFFSRVNKVPVYKLPVEPLDRPEVIHVNAGNFYSGFYYKNNEKISPGYIIDPDSLFGEVRDFSFPSKFINNENFEIDPDLTGKNKTPSGMGYFTETIKAGDELAYYSIVGTAQDAAKIDDFVGKMSNREYLNNKREDNKAIIEAVSNDLLTKSSSGRFDNYCQQDFIDNLLRGGYPVTLGKGELKKNFYVYSRIHGDMEREYNNFMVLPEYFSQGNGNYRDVNQNRRNDVFINPNVEDESIITFVNLLQLDGFNPLKIMGTNFRIVNVKKFLSAFKKEADKKLIKEVIKNHFSLGHLFILMEEKNIKTGLGNNDFLNLLIECSEKVDLAHPGECYWSDHWHYNIDLIESFLAVYPDKLKDLLLGKKIYTYYDNNHIVLPRDEKYVLFDGEPRQLDAVLEDPKKQKMISERKKDANVVRTKHGAGDIYKTTLLGKLLNLTANKYASLDPDCIGVEMESDRPNWCDALNGVPGTFGSSTAESFELKRLLTFLINSLKSLSIKPDMKITTAKETIDFLKKLETAVIKNKNDQFKFWDETHSIKEAYREKIRFGVLGRDEQISAADLIKMLELFLEKLDSGLNKSVDKATGMVATNYQYELVKYKALKEKGKTKKNRNGYPCIKALAFKRKPLPLFLEGSVHYLRIAGSKTAAEKFHKAILNSGLYDKKLNMIKVNAPLTGVPLTTGRITVFTSGWLENESVWTHMQYKYMLELLRNNAADEFFSISKTALVPFMDPKVYGRSIFENSSFIVSSAHPEEHIHGQGFVGRLSGATAEFISMWISITSGLKPFYMNNGSLCMEFKPQIPGSMFTEKDDVVVSYNGNEKKEEINVPKNSFLFKFLGKTIVIYHNPLRKDTYGPDGAKIKKMLLVYSSKESIEVKGAVLSGRPAHDLRSGKVIRMDVELG
ncbi:MAG: hypothetical protein ABH857_04300 [Elusimicrobiota bacterium]